MRLLVLLLYILVILHAAGQSDSHCASLELSVHERVVSRCVACRMHHLTVELRVHLVDVVHLNADILSLVYRLRCFHSASFVPPKQNCSANEEQESCSYSAQTVFQSSTVAGVLCFCVSHFICNKLMFMSKNAGQI